MIKVISALLLLITLSGCTFEKMGASEYGVVFKRLPRIMLGGVKERVIEPGEMEAVYIWEELYRFDTSVQAITWGALGAGDSVDKEDYVETRALDGNEVGLSFTVRYQIDPKQVKHILQYVGPTDEDVRRLVWAAARADIRTHMNVLKTGDFFNSEVRDEAVKQVKDALNRRLNPEGIVVTRVVYQDHRFERRLADGKFDRSYQKLIDETQTTNQKTEQERKRIATVIAQKRREFNEEKARVNRVVEEARGFKRQSVLRGEGYLEAKQNEANKITEVGIAEVEGLRKQIAALNGPGGKALLRMTLVKELLKNNPKFVVVNSSNTNASGVGFDLNRVDTNVLLEQSGIFAGVNEGLSDKPGKPADGGVGVVLQEGSGPVN